MPNVLMTLPTLDLTFSLSAKNINAGPIVMSRKCSDGGYLFVLRKDKVEKMDVLRSVHMLGSPYRLKLRRMKKKIVADNPVHKRSCLRLAGSKSDLYM